MELWSGTLSVFSAKVRIALREKALDVNIRDLPWTRAAGWGEMPRALLDMSPRGQVPLLVDGDLAVFDSTVINEYLEDRYPERPLLPPDPAGRARCRMWEELGDDLLTSVMPVLVREVFLKPGGEGRDHAAVDAAVTRAHVHYRRLEEALGENGHLCGAFSLADIGNFLAVGFLQMLGAAPGEDCPRLAAWFERVNGRPAVAREFDAIGAAAAAA